MARQSAVVIEGLELALASDARPLGTRVFESLVSVAQRAVAQLEAFDRASGSGRPSAVVGRLRGTGRGVSSSALFAELERAHPLELRSPFEGSDRVSGGVWVASDLLGGSTSASVAQSLCEKGRICRRIGDGTEFLSNRSHG